MFASRKGSLSAPVIKHSKFVLSFYSILTETDVRKSANDCTFASGEGQSSRGETFHALYAASPVSSSAERTVISPIDSSKEQ
jgi:hypothetical protein